MSTASLEAAASQKWLKMNEDASQDRSGMQKKPNQKKRGQGNLNVTKRLRMSQGMNHSLHRRLDQPGRAPLTVTNGSVFSARFPSASRL